MAIPRRLVLLLTATFLLLLLAMLLATAIEIRAPPPKMMAVTLAQAAKYGGSAPNKTAQTEGIGDQQTPPSSVNTPILALSYAGSGGPKHCRGGLLQKMAFERPAAQWNGTCIDLPSEARCGVFYAEKGDKCEAQLFNEADCHNTSMSYVNTVVFMPEERPVGGIWRSMWVRCGVDVPEVAMLDPGILGGRT
ncbi:hypothetical protein EKO04_004421 [Ascochyta lentis]|uniref:Uncharacterized protein n=1 Tax=Ascochyta lentis TaxID=205686 RepID=A0A8H7MIH5_9PLEO|nr:hypothetical protein EKO04_004421 [Ascochyta lentis]